MAQTSLRDPWHDRDAPGALATMRMGQAAEEPRLEGRPGDVSFRPSWRNPASVGVMG